MGFIILLFLQNKYILKNSLLINSLYKIVDQNHYKTSINMSTKAQHFRQSKSSNEQSFQALNQINDKNSHDQHKSRPSESSDFQNINEKRVQEQETNQKKVGNQQNFTEELATLQKLIMSNQKSVQEQLQIIKIEYKQKQRQIASLQSENASLKNKCLDLQVNARFYKDQFDKIDKEIKQQSHVSSSLGRASQGGHVGYKSPQKDFSKKKNSIVLNPLEKQLTENIKECYGKMNSLQAKIQLFLQQDTRIRQFLLKFLKFNPSFTMQLSTLVESAVISLDSNLKELNREVENIILGSHLGNSNKIVAKRQKVEEQKYNHWETLSNLEVIRSNVEKSYDRKN